MDSFFENDADYEMSELERIGNLSSELAKKGICTHGWWTTKPVVKCLHCGKEFESEDQLWQEYKELTA